MGGGITTKELASPHLLRITNKVLPERPWLNAEITDLRHRDDVAAFGKYHDLFFIEGIGAVAFFTADEKGLCTRGVGHGDWPMTGGCH